MKKIVIIVLAAILLALVVYNVILINGGSEPENVESTEQTVASENKVEEAEEQEKWEEGVITYDGKKYKFNNTLKTYLFMGIDKDGTVAEAKNYQDGGQSDAMVLLVVDDDEKKIKIVYINRNTMTDVKMFDEDGNSLGTKEAQICVAHGFGDGKQVSCSYAVDAVENLFNQVPVDGYLALNISAVPILNDYVGGVELTVLPGLEFLNDDKFKTGETVTLDGEMAYTYLRRRSTDEDYSADERLARHQQYISIFLPKFMEKLKADTSEAADFYLSIQDYLVTDLNAETLINQLSEYQVNLDDMYSVPGETIIGDSGYEEYIVDEDELYKLIIDVFYQEIDE